MKLFIVIPAYNEKDNIRMTLEELVSVTKSISGIDKLQIIVVDDHSSDNTFDIVKQMASPAISCIRLSRRCGSHISLRAGIREADGDAILCISADGQDNPDCLKDMLGKWQSGAKVIWGLKKSRKGEPWHIRKPAQLFFRFLVWLGGAGETGIDISRASFFLLDKAVANAVNQCLERNTSLFGLIAWLGFKQDSVEYDRRRRRSGKSKWNFKSQLRLARDWIISFTGLPLSLILPAGIIVTITGFVYTLHLIMNSIHGGLIQSWSVIIALILFIGGIQMVMLGIIGEYLWHNLSESRRRPLFLIENRSDKP